MKLRSMVCGFGITLMLTGTLLAAPAAPSENFNLSDTSKIPGATLAPGSYSIHLVNRLADRMILQVDGTGGTHVTFIGVPNSEIQRPASTGPVKWTKSPDGTSYLKGWYFPGSTSVVEFVYPKAEAVALATSNPSKVPAVDPASEGKPADNTLSPSDMKLLTLWTLSLEQVGPSPGIKAERYQQVASVSHKPVIAALPHTAGILPWVELVWVCSFAGAVLLRLFRYSGRTVVASE